MDNLLYCPICGQQIVNSNLSLDLRQVFDAWKPIHAFNEEIVNDHLKQSDYTTLYVCPNCALEIYYPQVIGSDEFYSDLQRDTEISYYREEKWDFYEACKDIQQDNSIIEFGCGLGNFLQIAQQKAAYVCGTEYNQDARDVSRSKGLTIYANEADLEIVRGKFDLAFAFHVLEHVADPIEFMNHMLSLLKPNGKIGISVPNQAGPLRHIESVFNMPPHHATHWQHRTFLSLAKRLNLNILRVAYEPLLLENHNYYSLYWLDQYIPGVNKASRYLKKALSIGMELFFSLLSKMGMKYFKFLRGQAIYVLMAKR